MKVLILAAGYGTRLYPLTLDQPKSLIKVAGRAILGRLLQKIEAMKDCDGAYIVTNDKFYRQIVEWVRGQKFDLELNVINDRTTSNEDRLGAIGDIDLVLQKEGPDEDVLVIAGDNLFEFDIDEFIRFSREKHAICIALYDVKDKHLASKYGIVSVDKEHRITRFQEKPDHPESTLASTGIYYFPVDKLALMKQYMKTDLTKDAPGNFIQWVSGQDSVHGFVFTEGWFDIGDKNSLEKADREYRKKGY